MTPLRHLRLYLAAAVLFPVVLVACGDDDSGSDDTPVPVTTTRVDAAPEQYIAGVCTAAAKMFTAYQKSFADNRESLGGMDPTDAYARTARAPFADLIADLEQLAPPSDSAAAHAETLRQAGEVLEALNQGDRQKLLSLRGTPDTGVWKQVIDLSPELKDRYGQASLEVGSCQELEASGAGNPFR